MLLLLCLLSIAACQISPPFPSPPSGFAFSGTCCYNFNGSQACGAGVTVGRADNSFVELFQKPLDEKTAGSGWPAGVLTGGQILDCSKNISYQFTNLGCQAIHTQCGKVSDVHFVFNEIVPVGGSLAANWSMANFKEESYLFSLDGRQVLGFRVEDQYQHQVCSYSPSPVPLVDAGAAWFQPPPGCKPLEGKTVFVKRHPFHFAGIGEWMFVGTK
jgi:hypothetical protein